VTIQLPIAQDTYIDEWAKDANYANAGDLRVRQPGVKKALLQTDALPIDVGATVVEAKLVLLPTAASNGNDLVLAVYAIEGPWMDSEVTWNSAPAASSWPLATTLNGAGAPIEVDITDLVQWWVNDPAANNGLMLAGDGSRSVEMAFMDADHGSMWPYVEITFQ
jgi:hypothetical protein